MSKLKVFSSALEELHTIDSIISCSKTEAINSDNVLSFSMFLNSLNKGWVNNTNVIGLDGDYYDISRYRNAHGHDGNLRVTAECEHISYRLNDPEYDMEYFTASGTPAAILAAILEGTGFSVGTVEFTAVHTYSAQEKKSRRALLIQFAELLDGELLFNGLSVSILTQRGSSSPKDLREGRNITVISKDVDKTRRDELGNPVVAYECDLVEPMELSLGDAVTMVYDTLGINITLRIVSITTNPYNSSEVSFSVSNTVPTIEDEAYEIATTTVVKDKLYNGIRIGPEYGFEAVRSDKKARAYFKSDGFAMQSGDGSGENWTDRLYFDPESGKYKFVGTVEIEGGSMDIGGNFVVGTDGILRLSGGATIYGGRYYAGTPGGDNGYVEMAEDGFRVYNAEGQLKIRVGFTADDYDYPFIEVGSGTGSTGSKGLFKKFSDGLWIGNSAPASVNGSFIPTAGYNGIFFDFTENKAYIVNGTDIQNIYTGEAIAKFG